MKVEIYIIAKYSSEFDRTSCDTSDNVSQVLQNCHYYFYRYRHNVFDVPLTDCCQYQSESVS